MSLPNLGRVAEFRSANVERARWEEVSSRHRGLDLNREVSRESPVLGYLAFAVKSPDACTARVLLGSGDGVRVWVDGQLPWSHEIHRNLTADEDRFDAAARRLEPLPGQGQERLRRLRRHAAHRRPRRRLADCRRCA